MLLERGHDPAEDLRLPWLLPGVKTLSYAVNMAAVRHARNQGAQDAVFMSSTDHRILEGATSSVVCARTHDATPTLLTPEPSRGILPGTSQARIVAAAQRHGWGVEYGPLYPEDLLGASAVWLTSSVRLAAPVTSVDGRPLPTDADLTRVLTDFLVGDGPR